MSKFNEFREEVDKAQADLFGPIYAVLETLEEDAEKYYGNGIKSAGNRVKKGMQDLRKLIKPVEAKKVLAGVQNGAKDIRAEIIEDFKS